MITEEEKINMKRDVACVAGKVEKLEQAFDKRPPAKETYEHFNKYNVDFALMGEEMKNLTKAIGESNKLNEEQHSQILSRIGRIEGFILGLLALFALAAVYFIFNKVGLHIP